MSAPAQDISAACRRDSPRAKLRWALICDGPLLPAWQAECIGHLLACGEAEPGLLIVAAGKGLGRRRRRSWRLAPGGVLYALYDRLRVRRRLRALRPVDIMPKLGNLPAIAWARSGDGADAAAAAAIRDLRIDFILHFASAAIDGDMLTAARLGVWSFRRPDEDDHGGLHAFWQLYRGEPAYFRVLRRLTPCGGSVLQSGCFSTKEGVARTIDAALFGSAEWCARTCRQLALEEPVGAEEPAAPPDRVPRNREFLVFMARRAAALARDAVRRLFLLEYWNIGIVDGPIESVIAAGRPAAVRWLPSPRRLRYHADPFVVGGTPSAVLFEEYSHVLGRGWISCMPLPPERAVPRPIGAFAGDAHHSYPYLFVAEGSLFCVPECAERRRVELYRAASFPHDWRRVATLIDGFPALDSTVFTHDGRWWLLCTSAASGGEHKLYAWHARSLLGPWQPHPLNPLKCDVSSTRPAGRPFSIDGNLCRPAQDCSRTYGGAITINRIVTLTPTAFKEITVGRIEPARDGEYRDGLHTVCAAGDMTIIDGKRFAFDARAAYLKLKARRTAWRSRAASIRAASGGRPAADPTMASR